MNISIIDNITMMTSYDFMVSVINPARVHAGEKPTRYRDLIPRIKDELGDDLPEAKVSRLALPQGGFNEMTMFDLTPRQMLLVGMRESKAVRRKVLEYVERLEQRNRELEQRVSAIGLAGVSRAGATWGDYCKVHGLPAQHLMTVLTRERKLFRVSTGNVWSVNPNYGDCFTVIKPDNNRFSARGINIRFTSWGLEVFSQDEQLTKMRKAVARR
ncbi:hypothetical protein FS593_17455 [Lelliottia amnigena]|uniref:hypothetical protein n=1 Tax=Lelliottia amnigena TaxID=61646 RepID=UPI001F485AED|nr:hypothetical protein [Lelliottia amnigena]UJD95958.1 hypothetical protein FS593_17455 [Lelliottia amnigena]